MVVQDSDVIVISDSDDEGALSTQSLRLNPRAPKARNRARARQPVEAPAQSIEVIDLMSSDSEDPAPSTKKRTPQHDGSSAGTSHPDAVQPRIRVTNKSSGTSAAIPSADKGKGKEKQSSPWAPAAHSRTVSDGQRKRIRGCREVADNRQPHRRPYSSKGRS